MKPGQPQGLVGGGGINPYRPVATPISRTEDARAAYVPRRAACLTVLRDERVLLNAEASRLVPKYAISAELQHPVRQRDLWQLSLQPGTRCRLSPAGQGRQCFRAPLATRTLFAQVPEGVDVLQFELETVGNGLFRLHPLTVTN